MEQIELTKDSFENKSTPIYSGLPEVKVESLPTPNIVNDILELPRGFARRRFRFTIGRSRDPPQDKFKVIHNLYDTIFKTKSVWDKMNRVCKCGHSGDRHSTICMSTFCSCRGYRRGDLYKITNGMYSEHRLKRSFRYFF